MNRKLALFLTIVIFAGIAFCFLTPARGQLLTYGEFGNIQPVYTEGNLDIPFTMSGETDLLTVTRLYLDGGPIANIHLLSVEHRQFSMCTADVNFVVHPWDDGTPFGLGTIEYLEDGVWIHYADIDNFAYAMPAINYTSSPSIVTNKQDECQFPILIPYADPCRYRVTFNFREVFGNRDSGFTCDDTVHHIAIEYEVPAASKSRYDILSLVLRSYPELHCTLINLEIRANYGELPFQKYSMVDVEAMRGGRWTRQDVPQTDSANYYQRIRYFDNCTAMYQIVFQDDLLEPDSDYRITMYFTEEEYSEDYMPLQVHIRTPDR